MRSSLTIVLIFFSFLSYSQVLRKRTTMLMGGRFDITIVAHDSAEAEMCIDIVIHEITRIENLISDWIPGSQVSQVNANAGIGPVHVNREVLELTERALALSRQTNGAFDISFAAMDRIWKFDGSMTTLPSPEVVKKSVEKVGYQNILIDKEKSTVFLKEKGMKIGFGALGEGYAADKSRDMMLARGVKAGIVNGSGDMSTWGKQPNGKRWTVGITNPMQPDTLFTVVSLRQRAVVTSGSYQKFVVFNGRRYSHIINPVTGYPATGVRSVTVFGPSAETANGCSTSMMVLGKESALEFIKKFPDYRYLLITDEGQVFASRSLKIRQRQLKMKD